VQPDPLLRAAGAGEQPGSLSLHLHIDGASRGNPGEAGFGISVQDDRGATQAELYGYLGRASNNVAEYQALLHALRWARARGAPSVRVYSDSELVVRQVNGQYRVKHPDMVPLHREATRLLREFESATVTHVRREQNRDADRLANQALDERASKLD
jgi:ribonuclease HI